MGLICENIQLSDDVNNKPSNKGHQTGRRELSASDVGPSEPEFCVKTVPQGFWI